MMQGVPKTPTPPSSHEHVPGPVDKAHPVAFPARFVHAFHRVKIGPQGIAFYGPDVPDIHILGATILGKDRSFPGIAFAIRFQLVMGSCFILCSCLAVLWSRRGTLVRGLATVQMILLLLFPFSLGLYVNGVIHNSDGAAADLRVYPHIGWLVYILLLVLSINTFVRSEKGAAYQTARVVEKGLAIIQLVLLLLLPFWLSPIVERGFDHNEAVIGLYIYVCPALVAYVLLLALNINTLARGVNPEARSTSKMRSVADVG